MNKTSRISIIFGLLVIPILLFGWLFIEQSLRDIAFSNKERRGVAALRLIAPLLHELTAGHDDAEIQRLAAELRAGIAPELNAAAELETLEKLVAGGAVAHQALTRQTRALISHIGDTSNLILDPDLDSYYIMDVVLMRLPDLFMSFDTEHSAFPALIGKQDPSLTERTAALTNIGDINAARTGMKASFEKAFLANTDGITRSELNGAAKELDGLLESFQMFARGLLLAGVSSDLLRDDTLAADLATKLNALSEKSYVVWDKAATELDRLLAKRIQGFERRLYIALALSGIVALTVIMIAIGLFRQLVSRFDQEIVFLAHHDPLTGLLNRASLTEALESAAAQAVADNTTFALHLIDLDRFKSINDSLGHGTGDELIRAMGERLGRLAGQSHGVGRLGGDEFVVIQRGKIDPATAQTFADRIVTAMRQPFQLAEHLIHATASVGIAIAPRHGASAKALLVSADLALYAAKAAGRDQALFFSTELEQEASQRRAIEEELRLAVLEDRFDIDFQALYNVTGTELRGFEALVRLSNRSGKRISPAVFIPLAEQLGLINTIGMLVLVKSCVIAARWPEHLGLAVNLSPIQFRDGKLPRIVDLALQKSGLAPHRLTVEITEGLLLDKSNRIDEQLQDIRNIGAKIAIDDFGSGYSNLAYLSKYRFDKIKIDRSFILALDEGRASMKDIIRTIISLGQAMGMTVVAEGIETKEQAALMDELACDEIQGYVFARPVPEMDVPGVILRDYHSRLPVHGADTNIPLRISA